MTTSLVDYQVLLHRMIYRKLQWLDYFGDGNVHAATHACHVFADLVVNNGGESDPDRYLLALHDATLKVWFLEADPASPVDANTLGTLFNNSREIFIASFHRDPVRTLPQQHQRFPWEHSIDVPQDPSAIDLKTLVEPLSPPDTELTAASQQVSPRLITLALVAVFCMSLVFIIVGLNQ